MTRKEEIENYLQKIGKGEFDAFNFDIGFESGVEWADAHPHWISVEDKLPMEYEPVLAAFGSHYARVCFYSGGKWYIDAGVISDEVFGVSHWIQIPPPPKKGE